MVQVVDDCKTRGRPHSLSCQDQVLVCLEYLRTYKTQLELSADYGISESNINRTIIKVENALIKSGQFNLPKRSHKPTHQDDDTHFEYIIIDACEVPCQRPKKAKTLIQWQTKTTHPKIQVIYNPSIKQIVSIRTSKGKTHDLTIARQHIKDLVNYQFVLADKGYIGLEHKGLIAPIKKHKNKPLPKEIKQLNPEINKRRIPIEHINAKLKVFKILSTTYRNHQKRFGLRVNLIAGIVNRMV